MFGIVAPTERLRGRKAVEQRKRRLAKEPLCRHCKAKGIYRIADEVDHIIPLALGGDDSDANTQPLCFECHAVKSALDGAESAGASTHPDWLKPSAIPLTIVCGPPCSGKTTYVDQHASPADTRIDFDTIAHEIEPTYRPWVTSLDRVLTSRVLRIRNAKLGSLKRHTLGQAWFTIPAPTKAERDWWQAKLGGQVLLLGTPPDECKRRAVARGTPSAAAGVDAWVAKAGRPWSPPAARQRIGEDGWPVEPG